MSAQNLGQKSAVGAESLNSVSTELETVAVLCSAVPEIDERLRELSAHVDGLDESTGELEDETSDLQTEINDLGKALGQLAENVTALEETFEEDISSLQSQQEDINSRLSAVEGCFHPDKLDKEQAHNEAQKSSIPFDRGDQFDLVVEEIQGRPDPTLRGKLQKVQTFVEIDDPAEYDKGDTVRVTITDLNGTAAHAAPTEEFER